MTRRALWVSLEGWAGRRSAARASLMYQKLSCIDKVCVCQLPWSAELSVGSCGDLRQLSSVLVIGLLPITLLNSMVGDKTWQVINHSTLTTKTLEKLPSRIWDSNQNVNQFSAQSGTVGIIIMDWSAEIMLKKDTSRLRIRIFGKI